MKIRSLKKIFQISLFVGFLITIYHLLSGEGVDAINYLIMRENDPRGIISWEEISSNIFLRHHIPFLITYPFSILGKEIGGILYILLAYLSLLFILKRVNNIKKNKSNLRDGYDFKDFFLLSPYIIIYILQPGKESIVFFSIASIFLTCYKLNNSIKNRDNKFKTINTIILIILFLFAVNIRPPILLFLGPSLIISFPQFFNLSIIKLNRYRFNIQYSFFIIFLLSITIFLTFLFLFNNEFYFEQMNALVKYGLYVYPEGKLNTGLDIYSSLVSNKIFEVIFSAFIFGIPISNNLFSNPYSLIVASIYFLSTQSLYLCILPKIFTKEILSNIKNLIFIQKINKDNLQKIFLLSIFIISFLSGGLVLSVGLIFNTGTGVRWMLPYIETLWLITKFLPEKENIKS